MKKHQVFTCAGVILPAKGTNGPKRSLKFLTPGLKDVLKLTN